jgi:methylated-DNA-protein-cysteine methyltransferase related protein
MYNPPDPKTYNAIVWEIVRQIPSGKVSTYGQIASMIPPPDDADPASYDRLSPRWVGNAMNAVSGVEEHEIPWQRVINSKGMISLPEGSRAALEQRTRLEAEGVVFDSQERVDFEVYGWEGPDNIWLQERQLFSPRSLKRPSNNQKPTQLNLL